MSLSSPSELKVTKIQQKATATCWGESNAKVSKRNIADCYGLLKSIESCVRGFLFPIQEVTHSITRLTLGNKLLTRENVQRTGEQNAGEETRGTKFKKTTSL